MSLKVITLISALIALPACDWTGGENAAKETLSFVIIDTLDAKLFDELHIKGAINIPYVLENNEMNPALEKVEIFRKEIEKKAGGLIDKNTQLFFYCADEMCTSSKIAADIAKKWGYNAEEYDSGLKGWLALSLWDENGSIYELDPQIKRSDNPEFKEHTYLQSIIKSQPDEATLNKWRDDARLIVAAQTAQKKN